MSHIAQEANLAREKLLHSQKDPTRVAEAQSEQEEDKYLQERLDGLRQL